MRIVVLLVIFGVGGFAAYNWFIGPIYEPSVARQVVVTRAETDVILHCIKSAGFETNLASLCVGAEDNHFLDNSAIFRVIADRFPTILELHPKWKQAEKLVDPWGHDYKVKISNPLEVDRRLTGIVTVLSVGPNGSDDNGGGDDVASAGDLKQ